MNQKKTLFFGAAIAFSFAISLASAGSPAKRPNLLVIITDEHHYNTLGCYGGKIVTTPNIDWLADNGAICTSYYATTPVCSPSRASLISGKYPQNTDVIQNNIPLRGNTKTLGSILGSRGYATGWAGKWHLDGAGKPQWAPKRNFGFEDNRYMFNRGHWKKFKDTKNGPAVGAKNKKGEANYNLNGADDKSFSTDWLVDKTLEFIKEKQNDPFCYVLSLPDPHGPNTVRPPYNTMYLGVDVPVPPSLTKQEDQTPKWAPKDPKMNPRLLRAIMPQYYGMVKCIDDNVGRIITALRETKALENTFIVFTSDHGDLCGEHGRANKGVPYEGSARIPFLLYAPGSVRPGTKINAALGSVDFLPTILPLLGQKVPLAFEGKDASSHFLGTATEDASDVTIIRGTGSKGWVAAISDRFKLVYSSNDKPWLFDLLNDPQELDNHFSSPEHSFTVKALSKALIDYNTLYNDPSLQQRQTIAQIKQVLSLN